jgi:hypothetical protein
MNERPAGITLIVILYFVMGFIALAWGLLVLGVGGIAGLLGGLFNAENLFAFGTTQTWSAFLGIISAILQFVVAFGLIAMKRWAYILALVGVGLNLVLGISGMLSGGVFIFVCGCFGLIIPIIIFIYLLSGGVRRSFGYG